MRVNSFTRALTIAAAVLCLGVLPASAQSMRVAPRASADSGVSGPITMGEAALLTDPFLQLPTENSVNVAWVTEFEGARHLLIYGEGVAALAGQDAASVTKSLRKRSLRGQIRVAAAETRKFSRMREDQSSRVPGRTYEAEAERPLWRHEAVASSLQPGQRVPYLVLSIREDGAVAVSDVFTLAPKPLPGTPLKILMTSDHQLKPNTPANQQMVEETIGRVDAVFFAGDLVNIPDRASEWFDDERGFAFFPGLQGKASYVDTKSGEPITYRGGEIIQHAPLFPAIGNHEVMGRVSDGSLGAEFNDPKPVEVAERAYEKVAATVNPSGDAEVREEWIKNHSFNFDSYLELFTLPESDNGGEKYYAVTIGDVRLISLFSTRIWRSPSTSVNRTTRFVESTSSLGDEMEQGWGMHIFERVDVGSAQYEWLERELQSDEFKAAKYRVVMLHEGMHSLGDNISPAFTDPMRIEETDADGTVTGVRYEYPRDEQYLVRDVEPLLDEAGVNVVFNGHSHLWNRFRNDAGVHFIETSNVGNNYGAYIEGGRSRGNVPPPPWNQANYAAQGDPYGLSPVVPNVSPLVDDQGNALPYVASNDYTVFSILDTGRGVITSYIYDVRAPELGVSVLDEFPLY